MSSSAKLRPRPPILRALGRANVPEVVTLADTPYMLVEPLKHDSWAATALYRGAGGALVVKFNREHPLFFLPMKWLGRWLAGREARALRRLDGVTGVPPYAGPVGMNGRAHPTAVAHWYIEGRPLHIDDKPGDDFFAKLDSLVSAIHERDMAYVDLNKRENIIIDDGGEPALVDFQLSFAPSDAALRVPPLRWLLRRLQNADRYHLLKHKAWHSTATVAMPVPPLGARIWRFAYVRPVQIVRRRLLVWLRVRDPGARATGELEPEKAARLSLERRAADRSARLPGQL